MIRFSNAVVIAVVLGLGPQWGAAQTPPEGMFPALPDFQRRLPDQLRNHLPSDLRNDSVESKSAVGDICGRSCPLLCGVCVPKDDLFCCQADGGGVPAFPDFPGSSIQ